MTIYEVIKRPIVTEKGVAKKDSERTLCFEVAPAANKTLVKAAVEQLFKVKVLHVNTLNVRGKARRERTVQFGRTPAWKKAIVTLKAGDKIELA